MDDARSKLGVGSEALTNEVDKIALATPVLTPVDDTM